MKNYFTFIVLFLLCGALGAQQFDRQPDFLKANRVWIFGENAGLDFNSGTAQPIAVPDFYGGGTVSVSDPETGQLLFYSDGQRCYNRDFKVMPHGDSLMTELYSSVGVQGVCAVPMIDSPGKYYLFGLEMLSCGGGWIGPAIMCHRLSYSIVDMSLDGGKGDIEPARKAMILDSGLTGSIIAVPGEDCDMWVLVHSTSDPDVVADPFFKAYHITADGLSRTPVVSTIRSGITTPAFVSYPLMPAPQAYLHSWMAVSPNRKMIAMGVWNGDWGALYPDGMAGPIFNQIIPVDLSNPNPGNVMEVHVAGLLGYKFDPKTGIVSDEIFMRNYGAAASVCFSPDNTKLYANLQGPVNGGEFASDGSTISQYDVSVWDSARVVTSKTDIYRTPSIYDEDPVSMRLYNDTIYFSKYYRPDVLGTISKPNEKGAASGFTDSAITLKPNTFAYNSFPNQVVYSYIHPDTAFNTVEQVICKAFDTVQIRATITGKDYTWDDGSRMANRTIDARGKYWVRYNADCRIKVDTFYIGGTDMDVVIKVNIFELSTTETYEHYQWLLDGELIPGATNPAYTITENGDYTVIVTQGQCSDTSDVYRVTNVGIGKDHIARSIKLYPNPAQNWVNVKAPFAVDLSLCSMDGRILVTEKSATHMELNRVTPGVYQLQIRDKTGKLLKVEKLVKQVN